MDSNFTSRPHKFQSEETNQENQICLILHNDDVNSFEYVMDALIEICDHSQTQAEQCAMIAHYKGKCEVRSGGREMLGEMRLRLISKGLKATIE